MEKTVFFIDIDGVLNSPKTRYKHNDSLAIDEKNLQHLKKIVDLFNADLVLISGWKEVWDKDLKNIPEECAHYGKYINWKFARHNLSIADKINGKGYSMRADGMREYVKKHMVDYFLVFDDEEDPEYYTPDIFCSWIQTNPKTGLTELDVSKAINMLNTQKKSKTGEKRSEREQKIRFVMGPACSGKSTFIKNTFPDSTVIDLYDLQQERYKKSGKSIQSCEESYYDTRDALIDALKNGSDVILEHTLLLQKRRPMYIEAVRSVTDAPIDIYVMVPTLNTFKKFRKQRGVPGGEKDELSFMEIPSVDEGFRNVYVVRPEIKKEN